MTMTSYAPEFFIKRTLAAEYVTHVETLQSLWSGYGHISRYAVKVKDRYFHVILKAIDSSSSQAHPRGWQSDLAHQRKVHSYEVETNWYQNWANGCVNVARVPHCLGVLQQNDTVFLLLEDLDEKGFDQRHTQLDLSQAVAVLQWLATFHAHFISPDPSESWPVGLWPQGTYWHLATRPNEWQAMIASPLKDAAETIDNTLRQARYQTLVHGDAKVANFCFTADASSVAAVDFQYVGRGIGVQDVAYFLGSCLSEVQLEEDLEYLLDVYFSELARCMIARGESPDFAESVITEWYRLFPVAWADFHRFIMGWCPSHAKNTSFSRKLTQQGLNILLT